MRILAGYPTPRLVAEEPPPRVLVQGTTVRLFADLVPVDSPTPDGALVLDNDLITLDGDFLVFL